MADNAENAGGAEGNGDAITDPCPCGCCDHLPDVTAFLEKFENGTFTIRPPEWFGPLMVGCFKQTLDEHDAPNYLEMRIGDKEGNVYPLILCRPNRPSPHQLREDAEREVALLKATRPDVGLDLEIVEEWADRLAAIVDEDVDYVLSDLRSIIDNHPKRAHNDAAPTAADGLQSERERTE